MKRTIIGPKIAKYLDSIEELDVYSSCPIHELTKGEIQSNTMSLRNRALMNFLLYSGCRRDEIMKLKIGR